MAVIDVKDERGQGTQGSEMTAFDYAQYAVTVPLKAMNVLADVWFYDTYLLNEKEWRNLCIKPDREGGVLVVSPRPEGGGKDNDIRHYPNVWRMLHTENRDNIKGVAVAGCGSTALGTAALALAVANAIGGDVVGVVSGHGYRDLALEGFGGAFFFGPVDLIMDWLNQQLPNGLYPLGGGVRQNLPFADIAAVIDLLRAELPNLNWLVGHSKGNLVIDAALEELTWELGDAKDKHFDELHVVTLGAVLGLPEKKIPHVHQVIGKWDLLGWLNSRPDRKKTVMPNSAHRVNPRLAFLKRWFPLWVDHLDIKEAIDKIRAEESGRARDLERAKDGDSRAA